jgi:hypothetical protein
MAQNEKNIGKVIISKIIRVRGKNLLYIISTLTWPFTCNVYAPPNKYIAPQQKVARSCTNKKELPNIYREITSGIKRKITTNIKIDDTLKKKTLRKSMALTTRIIIGSSPKC